MTVVEETERDNRPRRLEAIAGDDRRDNLSLSADILFR
jgi:hypothetical protein